MSDKPHGPMAGANPGSDGSWFDQDLYDAVMDGQMEPIGAFSGESAYRMGYEAAAKRAARIAAERQRMPVITAEQLYDHLRERADDPQESWRERGYLTAAADRAKESMNAVIAAAKENDHE